MPIIAFYCRKGKLISLLHQILNRTSQHLCKSADRVNARFIDVLLPLFIHLNRAQTNAGELRKLALGATVQRAETLQIGFGERFADYLINSIGELGDIGFVQGWAHTKQIIEASPIEDIALLR